MSKDTEYNMIVAEVFLKVAASMAAAKEGTPSLETAWNAAVMTSAMMLVREERKHGRLVDPLAMIGALETVKATMLHTFHEILTKADM